MALAGATKFTIVNRSENRGAELVKLLRENVNADAQLIVWKDDFRIPPGTNFVINATSIGLFPDIDAKLALDIDTLTSDMLVADVIPNPPRTRLVQDAQARGCKVIDGLGMLVNQGRIGIEYWTGVRPDAAVMRGALEAVFGV